MDKSPRPLITCPCGCGFQFDWSDKEAAFIFVDRDGTRKYFRKIGPGHSFYKPMAEQLRVYSGRSVLSQ